MPKDYARRSSTTAKPRRVRSSQGSRSPRASANRSASKANRDRSASHSTGFAWSAFAGGVLLGALTTLLVSLLLPGWISETTTPENGAGQTLTAGSDTNAVSQADTDGKPVTRFEFYDLLKRDHAPARTRNIPSAQADRSLDRDIEFLLQVGSFQNLEDAQRLRASLLLLGLDTNIADIRVDDGSLWHRVLVGPFEKKLLAQRATTKLRENGFDPLPLNRPRKQ